MLKQLTLEEFLVLAKTTKRVAVFQEIVADQLTPIGLYKTFSEEMKEGAMLESGLQKHNHGRFSFLAFDLIAKFYAKKNQITKKIGTEIIALNGDPLAELRKLILQLSYASREDVAEFVSHTIGFFTYDAIRIFEDIPDRHADNTSFPDIVFNFYRNTLTYDHEKQTLLISAMIEVGDNPESAYHEAKKGIAQLVSKIASSRCSFPLFVASEKDLTAETDISDSRFIELVKRAKDYITQGDAFQVVLSRCFRQPYTATSFDIYRALRRVSPSPYMFYLSIDHKVILGASPERMVRVHQGQVTINPIAGTRKRLHQCEEEKITLELLEDKKELAEHMMLVDLARNDLGAVCRPGSVEVSEFMQVKHYSHVSHLTSVVIGQLRDNFDALDAIRATFPAGTLSGAPKIRAMQIIDELETSRRGLYGGAICRFDYQGNMDSCIAIRMAVLDNGIATVRTGAGVVYDSDPVAEAQETRQKAKAMLDAITFAHEGEYDFAYR